jgi:hypothetical protein
MRAAVTSLMTVGSCPGFLGRSHTALTLKSGNHMSLGEVN